MVENPYPSPRKTPKRKRTTENLNMAKKTKTAKKSNSKKALRKRYKKIAKKSYKYRKIGSRAINVKTDVEGYSRTYIKQKVTRKQQKAINKRFKQGYSPFIKNVSNVLQLTSLNEVNKCKWLWFCDNTLKYVLDSFALFPNEDKDVGTQYTQSTTAPGKYFNGPEQTIYFSQFKQKYEIMNPTNTDLNLVIYDIIYKQDSLKDKCNSAYYESSTSLGNFNVGTAVDYGHPIGLIYNGYNSINNSNLSISDSVQTPWDSINAKPTQSYPFNIYCKVVKKHTFKLQPGATMTHTFVHKPKCLFNRGYLYKYQDIITNANIDEHIGVKDLTSGCLFKIWGQLGNSGDDDAKSQVLAQAGRIAVKYTFQYKWYTMNNKFKYIFNSETAWNGKVDNVSVLDKLETVTDTNMEVIKEQDLDSTNNTDS